MPPLVNPAALHRSTAVCAWRLQRAQKRADAVRCAAVHHERKRLRIPRRLAPGTCSVTGSASRNTRPRSSSTHPARAPRNIARGRISSTPPAGAGSGVLQIILWYTRPPTVLVFSAAEYCAYAISAAVGSCSRAMRSPPPFFAPCYHIPPPDAKAEKHRRNLTCLNTRTPHRNSHYHAAHISAVVLCTSAVIEPLEIDKNGRNAYSDGKDNSAHIL